MKWADIALPTKATTDGKFSFDAWKSIVQAGKALELAVPDLTGFALTPTELSAAALTKTITLYTQAASECLTMLIVRPKTAFVGVTTLILDLGTAADPTKYVNGLDLMQTNPLIDGFGMEPLDFDNTTAIQAKFTATGANLDQLSAGLLHIWVSRPVLPTPQTWSA